MARRSLCSVASLTPARRVHIRVLRWPRKGVQRLSVVPSRHRHHFVVVGQASSFTSLSSSPTHLSSLFFPDYPSPQFHSSRKHSNMATSASSASPAVLPPVPAKHADFIPYVAGHPDKSIHELLEPYKQYDAKLREVFAQEPQHQALEDGYLNVVPVFRGREGDVRVRARDLEKEDAEEAKRYVAAWVPFQKKCH